MAKDLSQTVDLTTKHTPTLRKPDSTDGAAIWALIKDCKPLDENSMYCNLVQADHFRDTCVLAELDGAVVGWISGHIRPDADDTLFIWQVAVSSNARGLGLGSKMLDALLKRDVCADVSKLQTTITEDNDASWALFRSFANRHDGELTDEPYFVSEEHFDGYHDTEHMVTINLAERMKKAA